MPEAESAPRPFCFMVMPFGKRASGSSSPDAPPEIDFDALWDRSFRPALEKLGYAAIRGDDRALTSNILRDILECIALSDLVVADITATNANVFYELGLRHAVPGEGKCVMLAASWAQPPFDVQGMRQLRYALPKIGLTDADYKRVEDALVAGIPVVEGFDTPMSLVSGYPQPKQTDAKAFAKRMREIEEFQAAVRGVRLAPKAERRAAAQALLARFAARLGDRHANIPGVVRELVATTRDQVGWCETLELIEKLPQPLRDDAFISEQALLAQAKLGDPRTAIAKVEQLIAKLGSTPEREGLLGGRWKQVFGLAQDDEVRAEALDKMIEHYTRGMELDLNEYYCACNLPRRLRQRGTADDLAQAAAIVPLVIRAAQRTLRRNPEDRWALFTLLGTSFDAADANAARKYLDMVKKAKPADWEVKATLDDVELALSQQAAEAQRVLAPIAAELRRLLPAAP